MIKDKIVNGYYQPNITTSRGENIAYTTEYAIDKLQQENKQLKDKLKGVQEERDYLFNKQSIENKYLTKENQQLKELKYKFFDASGDEESFTLEDYLDLSNKVYDLERENERLKEKINRLKTDLETMYQETLENIKQGCNEFARRDVLAEILELEGNNE